MNREYRLYVEFELRRYEQTKANYESLKHDIIHESPVHDGQPKSPGGVSRPTERKALRITSNVRLRQMEHTLKSIDTVLMSLPEDRYKMVQMRYWDRPRTLTDDGIALRLNIDKRTLYRWIDGLLQGIAKEMGLK